MPDEPNTITPTQSATPTDGVPVIPDPQKLVDEALSPNPTPTPTVSVEPTMPSAPVLAAAEPVAEPKQEETVPAELLAPASAPTPTPEPVMTTPSPVEPEVSTMPPVEPPTTPEVTTPQASSPGEEVPLAFAGAPVTGTPSSTLPNPAETSVPVPEIPPVAPPPSMTPPKPEKKKKKGGKILALIAGFFLLAGALFGGYYYYANTFGEGIIIAEVDRIGANCPSCDGGHKVKEKNGKCVWTSKPCDTGSGGVNNKDQTEKDKCTGCTSDGYKWEWRNDGCSRTNKRCLQTGGGSWVDPDKAETSLNANGGCDGAYTPCKGRLNKCVKTDLLAAYGGGCNKYSAEVYNLYPDAVSYTIASNDKTCAAGKNKCTCGNGTAYCFSTEGYCGEEPGISGQTKMMGLCAITPDPLYTWKDPECAKLANPWGDDRCKDDDDVVLTNKNDTDLDGSDDGIADWFNQNGLKNEYENVKNFYYCPGQISDTWQGCSTIGKPVNINCFCGTIQIDTGSGFQSRTMKCGCNGGGNDTKVTIPKTPAPSPTPSPTPKLACANITKDKDDGDIKVGSVVKFNCKGTSTPAGAVNLKYNFQIKKDSGDWTDLTATGSAATYTVAATGTYQARCRACGTINNASVCDPTWTGATQ